MSDAATSAADIARGIAAVLRERLVDSADTAIVFGSGLGDAADALDAQHSIAASDLPGYPASTVPGHEGRITAGRIGGKTVLAFRGRMHVFEGFHTDASALPAFIAAEMGVQELIVTNAAGGVHPLLDTGDLMLVTDYLVLPLSLRMGGGLSAFDAAGGIDPRGYGDAGCVARARTAANDAGIQLREGCYGYCSGPSYETRAEIAFLRGAGVDAIGMSSVPEIVAASRRGIRTVAISCITNKSAVVPTVTAHDDVTRVAGEAAGRLHLWLEHYIRAL
ncbi:MAG: purine-nucleoside phosphorylase [Ignavibacteriae bacterium]|nr:purine-nucleoside phosphorylase [Ignavibacteriota bacterium]